MGQLMRDTAGEAAVVGRGTPIDLEETEDAYLMETDLPSAGQDRQDRDVVTVDVTGHEIRVSGEVKHCGHTGLLHRQTRRAARFDQVVSLPGKVEITAA